MFWASEETLDRLNTNTELAILFSQKVRIMIVTANRHQTKSLMENWIIIFYKPV